MALRELGLCQSSTRDLVQGMSASWGDQALPHIQELRPYVPGKPVEETQREFGLDRVIKLASNENPLGMSPLAAKALDQLDPLEVARYPDASAYHLKRQLSEIYSVQDSQITVANGSEEVIELLIRSYIGKGDAVLTSYGAFICYRVSTQAAGGELIETPMTPEMQFDLEAMEQALSKDDRIKIAFIANPNNPTGTWVDEASLRKFIQAAVHKDVIVALDYAYWEYVDQPEIANPVRLMKDFPDHVVMLRTFSKIYGLAALRVGYGIGPASLMEVTNRLRRPFTSNSLALMAAQEALKDTEFVDRARQTNATERVRWEDFLSSHQIPFWPSQGNFILVDTQKGLNLSGGEVFESCLKKGVIFRPVDNYGLPHALRISIGTEEENDYAMRTLQSEFAL